MRILKLNDFANCAGIALMNKESQKNFALCSEEVPGCDKGRCKRKVILNCKPYQLIDPTPAPWAHAKLKVNKSWIKLGINFTHYKGENDLILINCGRSRFALWRQLLHSQGSTTVIRHLQPVYCKWEHQRKL